MNKPTHNRSITKADKQAAARLKAIWQALPREERPTQQQLADMWDLPSDANQSLMSQYLNGQIALNYPALLFFAKALNCEPTEIRDDLPEQKAASTPTADEDVYAVPGYAHSLALGDGSTPDEYAEAHRLLFRKSSMRKKGLLGRRLEVYYGRGDSMEPRIHDGDALLIDRDDTTPRDGEIFALENDSGEALVKRLTNIDGRWFYESDNKSDPKRRKPVPLSNGRHEYRIVGAVRWIGSWEG